MKMKIRQGGLSTSKLMKFTLEIIKLLLVSSFNFMEKSLCAIEHYKDSDNDCANIGDNDGYNEYDCDNYHNYYRDNNCQKDCDNDCNTNFDN